MKQSIALDKRTFFILSLYAQGLWLLLYRLANVLLKSFTGYGFLSFYVYFFVMTVLVFYVYFRTKSFCCLLSEGNIQIHTGVLIKSSRCVPFLSAVSVKTYATPLMSLLALKGAVLFLKGSVCILPPMPKEKLSLILKAAGVE